MTRQFSIYLTVFFFWTVAYGQTKDSLTWYLIGKTVDSTVKAFVVCNKNSECNYLIKYKSGNKWDTISFADKNVTIDSCQIEKIQIDGKGEKEIIIKWNYLFWHTSAGHGGFEEGYSQIDIWNLDRRKKIFSATPDYHFQSLEVQDIMEGDSIVGTNEKSKSCFFNYHFEINSKGQIIIKNIEVNGDNDCKADHQEGIYTYLNGEYIWTKKNDG
jgi:hypothetical protein